MQKFAWALVIAPALAAPGYMSTAATAQMVDGPKVHWNYSYWGKSRAATTYIEGLSGYLDEKTGGKFTIQFHWGTLSQPRANLDGIKLNAFPAATFCASYYPGSLPAMNGLDLPFLPISEFPQRAYVSDEYTQHPVVKAEFDRWNAMYYMNSILPSYEFVGKGKAPHKLEDWKGLRVRALGQMGEAMKFLGAVPTNVTAPEAYVSMDRGLIDAVGFAYYAHQSYRTYELGTWFTNGLDISTVTCGAMFSKTAWDELPDNYKQLVMDYRPTGYRLQADAYNETELKLPAFFKEKGLEEIVVAKAERQELIDQAAKPVWKAWVEEMTNEHGYPGQELLDLILASAEKHQSASF